MCLDADVSSVEIFLEEQEVIFKGTAFFELVEEKIKGTHKEVRANEKYTHPHPHLFMLHRHFEPEKGIFAELLRFAGDIWGDRSVNGERTWRVRVRMRPLSQRFGSIVVVVARPAVPRKPTHPDFGLWNIGDGFK